MSDSFLEQVWENREEVVYRRLFGATGDGIYPIPAAVFTGVFQQDPDPRWIHLGVFACPPHDSRDHWLYVSSGLTNPWELERSPEEDDCLSGLGVEYIFETSEPGDWAIQLLHRVVAFDVLLSHGRYPGREPLKPGDRIPVRGPIQPGTASELTWLLITRSPTYSEPCRLESGEFHFLHAVGVTESEAALAREEGVDALVPRLETHDAYPVTRPTRSTVVDAT
ncbi:MAG: suppressor of fused domain protein [Proteobacteria bacterium]|nr:suppressor of fused domain protein [Pseudomonadota bacterium]